MSDRFIACSTSAFRSALPAALSTVRQMGFTTVDLIAIPGWDHVSLPRLVHDFDAYAEEIERLLEQHSLRPIAMNLAVGNLHQRADAAANAERLKLIEGGARLMQRLGIPIASFYPGYLAAGRGWEEVLADEAATLREMLETAFRYGVTLAIELHRFTPFETVEQGRRLLEAVPELTVAYDPSHYTMQGINLRETRPFLERAAHVHLRDAAADRMQAPFGEGEVDFEWLLQALDEIGYSGSFSIEYLPDLEGAPVEEQILALRGFVQSRVTGLTE